jgi:drug/metabolite transporter (DMT)-like permease
LAHLSLTSALTLAPASFVMPIDFIRLPLIAVIGAMAYGEAIDPFVLGGGAVIFLGIWISIRAELRQKNRSKPN